MLSASDPHSSYMDASNFAHAGGDQGEFGGAGVTQEDGQVKVVTLIDDTPAAGRHHNEHHAAQRRVDPGLSLDQAIEDARR